MIKTLLSVVGLFMIFAALPLVAAGLWFGGDTQADEATIGAREAERGKTKLPIERADKDIAEARQSIEAKVRTEYLSFGAAAGSMVVGVVLLFLSSTGKKKKLVAASPAPAPENGVPDPSEQHP
jgi:hypothetical protein